MRPQNYYYLEYFGRTELTRGDRFRKLEYIFAVNTKIAILSAGSVPEQKSS